MRRAVLGDDHVDAAEAGTTAFTAPFQEYVTTTAWGDVWSRDGIDRRTRSAVTLAALTALRATDELALHVTAALRNGLTAEEIGEVLLHTAVYAGAPAARAAFAVADRVITEHAATGHTAEHAVTGQTAEQGVGRTVEHPTDQVPTGRPERPRHDIAAAQEVARDPEL